MTLSARATQRHSASMRRLEGDARCGTVSPTQPDLAVMACEIAYDPPSEGVWWSVGAIEEAGLATLFAKAVRLAVAVD